jgi:biopolymer transport protein ExbD
MKRYLERKSLQASYVTPLIDILFILIIFFVLAGSYDRFSSISVSLTGRTGTVEASAGGKEYLLQIDSANAITFENSPIPLTALSDLCLPPQSSVTLAVDRQCRLEIFAQVFEIMSAKCGNLEILYQENAE